MPRHIEELGSGNSDRTGRPHSSDLYSDVLGRLSVGLGGFDVETGEDEASETGGQRMPREDETLRKSEGDGQLSEESRKAVFEEKEREAAKEPPHEREYSGPSEQRGVGNTSKGGSKGPTRTS